MFTPSLALELREKINKVFYEGRVVPKHTETQHFYQDVEDGETYASVTTKTSLLSRSYYKQMAADKAVDHIQNHILKFGEMSPEQITEVFSYAREAHKHDLERAGLWGSHGHDTLDKYMQAWLKTNERPKNISDFFADISNEGKCAALSGELFVHDYTVFPVASELRVISKKHKYAGTLDSLWLVGDVAPENQNRCVHTWFEKGKNKIKCHNCGQTETLSLLLGDWKSSNQIFGYGAMGKYEYAMQVAAYDMALTEMVGIKCKKHWIVRLDKQRPYYEIGVITDIKKAGKAFLSMNMIDGFAHSKIAPIEPLNKKNIITL